MEALKTPYLDKEIERLNYRKENPPLRDSIKKTIDHKLQEYQSIKAALKRLGELEEVNFNQRRELLIGFEQWYGEMEKSRSSQTFEETVDEYLKSLNP